MAPSPGVAPPVSQTLSAPINTHSLYRLAPAHDVSIIVRGVKKTVTRALLTASLSAALVLTGCAGDGESSSSSPATTSVKAAIAAPRVTVITPGEGERAPVAYQDMDATQKAPFNVSLGFSQQAIPAENVSPEAPAEVEGAPLTGSATLSTAQLTDDEAGASRSVSMTLTDLVREDPSAASVADTVDVSPANGIIVTWEATGTGRVTSISYEQPEASTDEVNALLEGYVSALLGQLVIFPDDPLAPGARWTVEMPVIGESNTSQETTYTLVSHEGTTVVVDATVSQRPTVGSLTLDSGEKVDIQSAETTSSSRLTIDLSQPYPVAGLSAFTTRTVYGNADSLYAIVQDAHQSTSFG